jgi:hypothetical protein
MGRPWRKHTNNLAVERMPMISFLIVGLLHSLINVNPTPQLSSTMDITLPTSISKEKPNSRAENSKTATTPNKRRSTWHSKSPHSADVESLLAEINLPTS